MLNPNQTGHRLTSPNQSIQCLAHFTSVSVTVKSEDCPTNKSPAEIQRQHCMSKKVIPRKTDYHSGLFRFVTEHSIKESASQLGPSRDPCQSLSSSRTGRIKGPAATPEWPTASKRERNGHKRHDLSAKQTQTETLVRLRLRHESCRANEMGSRALNGCHAEAERHWGELLPSQVSLVHASWPAAARFCQGHKGRTALGPSESPGLLVFAVTRGQGRGSLLTSGSFMLQRPIGDGS